MPAGRRNTPLWIQAPVEAQQADGSEQVTGYTNVTKWWAEQLAPGGREGIVARQMHGTRALVFRGLFIPNITVTTKMVLASSLNTALAPTDGTRRYDIQGADDPDGRRRELVITAVERGV